jgi:hypothetical protein
LGYGKVEFRQNEYWQNDQGTSPWALQLICVRENDESDPPPITSGIKVSVYLYNLSLFFKIVCRLMPIIQCYEHRFYRENLNIRARLTKSAISLVQKESAEKNGFGFLGYYPFKVIYVEGLASGGLLDQIGELGVKPLVVCDESQTEEYEARGCSALSFDHATSSALNREIGRLAIRNAQCGPILSRGPALFEPILAITQHPDRYSFERSSMQEAPVHDSLIAQPNELLANRMLRVFGDDQIVRGANGNLMDLQMASMSMVLRQQAIDFLLVLRESGRLPPTFHSFEANLDLFLASGDEVVYQRLIEGADKFGGLPKPSFSLFVPCLNKAVTKILPIWKLPSRVLRILFKGQDQNFNPPKLEELFTKPSDIELASEILRMQNMEHEFLGNIQTLYSFAESMPSIRVPQLPSAFHGKLREIRQRYDQLRVSAHTSSVLELNRSIFEFGQELRNALPQQIIKFIRERHPHSIRLFSDLPLEWMDIDGVPLSCTCRVSRIPLTPGDGLLRHYLQAEHELTLSPAEANRVLIVNCLKQTDSLFAYPKTLADSFTSYKIVHKYKEVASIDEFKSVLKETRPFILIYFGHGEYDRMQNVGLLEFRDGPSKIWDLRDSYIPPIVLLGACDTAAIAETEGTPSNAFLALGSRSVLGTLLPVQADWTVELFLQILHSLWDQINNRAQPENWGGLVAAVLVANGYRDYLNQFNRYQASRKAKQAPSHIINPAFVSRVKADFGAITPEIYKRYGEILGSVISQFDKAAGEDFGRFVASKLMFPHTMLFTHLGSPETIRIIGNVGQQQMNEIGKQMLSARSAHQGWN